ncbi:DNA translocase FtsK 4TM domain-containing protein, partial [Magnetococcales bacterium HHB-1]
SLTLFFGLSIFSYHRYDPSFNFTGLGPPENLAGISGAHLADLLFQTFGFSAASFPLLFAFYGILLLRKPNAIYWDHLINIPIFASSTSILSTFLFPSDHPWSIFFPSGAGGILGQQGYEILQPIFGFIGGLLLLFPLWLLSFMVLTRLSLIKSLAYLAMAGMFLTTLFHFKRKQEPAKAATRVSSPQHHSDLPSSEPTLVTKAATKTTAEPTTTTEPETEPSLTTDHDQEPINQGEATQPSLKDRINHHLRNFLNMILGSLALPIAIFYAAMRLLRDMVTFQEREPQEKEKLPNEPALEEMAFAADDPKIPVDHGQEPLIAEEMSLDHHASDHEPTIEDHKQRAIEDHHAQEIATEDHHAQEIAIDDHHAQEIVINDQNEEITEPNLGSEVSREETETPAIIDPKHANEMPEEKTPDFDQPSDQEHDFTSQVEYDEPLPEKKPNRWQKLLSLFGIKKRKQEIAYDENLTSDQPHENDSEAEIAHFISQRVEDLSKNEPQMSEK